MNRISALIARAGEVRRKAFQAQPFSTRVAHVMVMLAGLDPLLSTLGRSLGAVFILKKTEGLPDVHGQPALAWVETLSDKDVNAITRKLPPNYLDNFAQKLKQNATAQFGMQAGTDALVGWLTRFIMGGWKHMQENQPIDRILKYCMLGVKNEALNGWKADKNRRKDISINDDGDDDRRPVDPGDPSSMKDFLEESPMWKMPRVRKILEQKVHPDAPLFLDLLFEGHSMKDIVGDKASGRESMLPHVKQQPMAYYNWMKTYNPKIVDVLSKINQEERV